MNTMVFRKYLGKVASIQPIEERRCGEIRTNTKMPNVKWGLLGTFKEK